MWSRLSRQTHKGHNTEAKTAARILGAEALVKSQDKGKQSHSRGGGFRGGKLDKMSVQDYNKWIDLNRRIALLEAKLNRYEAQIIGLENKIKQGTEELIYLKQGFYLRGKIQVSRQPLYY